MQHPQMKTKTKNGTKNKPKNDNKNKRANSPKTPENNVCFFVYCLLIASHRNGGVH